MVVVVVVVAVACACGGRGGWWVVVGWGGGWWLELKERCGGEIGSSGRRCSRSTNAPTESDDGATRVGSAKPHNKLVCVSTHTHTHTHTHHPITHTYTRTHTHACLSARLSRIRLCRIRQPFLVVGNNTHGPATGAFDTARQEPDIGVPTRYAADAGGEAERPTGQLQESRAGGGVQAQALAMARRARSGGGARRCSVQRVPERL